MMIREEMFKTKVVLTGTATDEWRRFRAVCNVRDIMNSRAELFEKEKKKWTIVYMSQKGINRFRICNECSKVLRVMELDRKCLSTV